MGKKLWTFLAIYFFAVCISFAQKSITGVVIEKSTGEPVVGASVLVAGTTVGAATDINGKFTISNVPANAKTLHVTYIGMESVDVAAKDGIRILMSSVDKNLNEVMVVAYGTMKKSSFTGSAAEIKSEDIQSHIATDVTSVLANTTAGVQLNVSNGDPASETLNIRIRGIGSINSSNNPLIILDGMPYSGAVSSINPQDVESMTVLKDAAASAIYGARGANGVIIITTKKGRKQDAEIHFDARWGVSSRAVPQYDLIDNPAEYYETAYKQLYNDYVYSGFSQAEAYRKANSRLLDAGNGGVGYLVYTLPKGENLIGTNFKLNPNAKLGYSDGEYYYTPDDWYKETVHNGFRQEYNFSINGATDKFNYYVSAGYLDQNGIVENSRYKRFSSRSSVDYQVKKWFKLGAQFAFTHSDSQQPSYDTDVWGSSGNLFYIVNNIAPIYPLYVRNADGTIKYDNNGLVVYDSNQTGQKRPSTVGNAVRDNRYNRNQNYRDMFNGNWSGIFTPVKDLTLTARIGVTADNRRNNNLNSVFANAVSTDGSASVFNYREFSFNNQYLANYVTDFGTDGNHNLDFLVGYEQYKYKYQYNYGYNTHLYNPLIGELGNAFGPGADKDLNSCTTTYMTEGVLSRLQYDYQEKYVFSASYRRDASSRFAKGHRWGNFYSFGAAWNMAKEEFMSDLDWVDLLKVKVSYGEQGNDDLYKNGESNYYPYAEMYDITYDEKAGQYSKTLSQVGNDDLTWEKSRNFNLGVDFGFFKSRLSGSIEFFNRATSDLLYYMDLPLSSGYGSLQKPVNVGSIRNTGIEIQLNGSPIRTKDFTWDINFNGTHYKNKITSLSSSVGEEGIKTSTRIYRVGGSVYQARGVKYAGVYTENNFAGEAYDPSLAGKAMYYYDDEDADGNVVRKKTTTFSQATNYDLGDILPSFEGGLGMKFRYHDFDLSYQLGYQFGGKIYDSQYQVLMHTSEQGVGFAWHKDALNAWSETNKCSDIPRLESDFSVSQSVVDRFYINSDYISLNNVTLGYTLPKILTTRVGIESLRLYVAGENLFVLSSRKGLDPRYSMGIGGYTSGTGMASGSYSVMRTVTAGLSLSF